MVRSQAGVAVTGALLIATLVACGDDDARGAGSSTTSAPRTDPAVPEELLPMVGWIRDHPGRFSLAVRPGVDGGGIEVNAAETRPAASTFKVAVLVTYAHQVAAGQLDPDEQVPVGAVDRWVVEGTDGGAHSTAMTEFAQAGTITLDEVAAAMTEHSDNAATDYLLARLGSAAVADVMGTLGLDQLGPIAAPTAGALLAVTTGEPATTIDQRLAELSEMDSAERARIAWTAAQDFETDPVGSTAAIHEALATLTTWDQQLALTDALPWWAPPRDLALLVERAVIEERLGHDVAVTVTRHLSWPMEDPTLADRFTLAGAKDGVTAGVLAVVGIVQPRHGDFAAAPRVVAVNLSGLDQDTWTQLLETEAHLQLALALAADPTTAAALAEELG